MGKLSVACGIVDGDFGAGLHALLVGALTYLTAVQAKARREQSRASGTDEGAPPAPSTGAAAQP